MKGIIFTELFEFVEDQHDPFFLQDMIEKADVPSKGVYTAVGTYPVCEMGALLTAMSQKTGVDIPNLMKVFGKHLFARFVDIYPHFFEGVTDAYKFLDSIENHIHKEVKKLYPDAELPTFETTEFTQTTFKLIYRSSRHLGDVCEGLIIGCLEYFGDSAELTRRTLENGDFLVVEFTLKRP